MAPADRAPPAPLRLGRAALPAQRFREHGREDLRPVHPVRLYRGQGHPPGHPGLGACARGDLLGRPGARPPANVPPVSAPPVLGPHARAHGPAHGPVRGHGPVRCAVPGAGPAPACAWPSCPGTPPRRFLPPTVSWAWGWWPCWRRPSSGAWPSRPCAGSWGRGGPSIWPPAALFGLIHWSLGLPAVVNAAVIGTLFMAGHGPPRHGLAPDRGPLFWWTSCSSANAWPWDRADRPSGPGRNRQAGWAEPCMAAAVRPWSWNWLPGTGGSVNISSSYPRVPPERRRGGTTVEPGRDRRKARGRSGTDGHPGPRGSKPGTPGGRPTPAVPWTCTARPWPRWTCGGSTWPTRTCATRT